MAGIKQQPCKFDSNTNTDSNGRLNIITSDWKM